MKQTQRYQRRLAEAELDAIEVLKTYSREIKLQYARMDASKNGFIRTCCQQEIDRLSAERDAIEFEILG